MDEMFRAVRSLLAFSNPSTDFYRRVVSCHESATNLFFSWGNRSDRGTILANNGEAPDSGFEITLLQCTL